MRGTALFRVCRAQLSTSRFLYSRNLVQVRPLASKAQQDRSTGDKSSQSKASSILPSKSTVFLLCGSVLTGVFLYKRYYVNIPELVEEQLSSSNVIGKVALGCEWALTDHEGRERKSSDFHGQFVLLYFGFTHCPDICPVEVEKMCAIVDRVDKFRESGDSSNSAGKLYKITPLMISVDPERDTPAVLKKYCTDFSPKLLGLTGTPEQVEQVARDFHVYHARTRSTSESDSERDYLVDHTIVTYLIGPSGQFVDYYGQYKPAEDVAGSVVMHMVNERNRTEQAN